MCLLIFITWSFSELSIRLAASPTSKEDDISFRISTLSVFQRDKLLIISAWGNDTCRYVLPEKEKKNFALVNQNVGSKIE